MKLTKLDTCECRYLFIKGCDEIAFALGVFSIRRDFIISLNISSNLIDTEHNSDVHKLTETMDSKNTLELLSSIVIHCLIRVDHLW
jgi:hypothetical protein